MYYQVIEFGLTGPVVYFSTTHFMAAIRCARAIRKTGHKAKIWTVAS